MSIAEKQRVCRGHVTHPRGSRSRPSTESPATALDLSGEEFLAALDEGKFDDVDPDANPGLLDVLMALPLVR